jgi:plastocyanin
VSKNSDSELSTFNRPTTRRAMLGLFGGVAAIAGTAAVGRSATASGGRTGRHSFVRHQESTPMAMEMATPTLGAQPDGTNMWRVRVGTMDMERGIEYQAFLPGEITVNAGDSIWFDTSMPGFHTVTFPVGGEVPPIFVADETATPEAGTAPNMLFNPALVYPSPTFAVDGSTYVNSGVTVFADPTVPFIFTFPVAGTYDYLCIPHQAVMLGRVIVQDAGSALPMDQAAVDQAGEQELAALVAAADADIAAHAAPATSVDNADGTKTWSAIAGSGGLSQVRVMQFWPNVLEIGVGDTVTWVNESPGEPHTVTFVGPDAAQPEDVLIVPSEAGPPKVYQNNETLLPQGGNTFSGTGYVNSGWFGIPELGLPMEWSCTFDAPGEYIYYCILHGGADGTGMAARLKVS